MNIKNYDPAVISTFDIIGCYFVDIFYNHLYLSAESIRKKATFANNANDKSKQPRSLTDEYKSAVNAYMVGVTKDEKYYKKTITGLQTFYQTYTKYNTIGLNAFIDRIINTFLPEEYAGSLGNEEKEFFLNEIISSIIKEFCIRAVDIDHLRQIIDYHDNEENTRFWVNEFVTLQIAEREKIFQKFTRKLAGHPAEHYEKVDAAVAQKIADERDRIWRELESKIMELTELKAKYEESRRLAAKMHNIIRGLEAQVAEMRAVREQTREPVREPVREQTREPVREPVRERKRKTFKIENFDDVEPESVREPVREPSPVNSMSEDSDSESDFEKALKSIS